MADDLKKIKLQVTTNAPYIDTSEYAITPCVWAVFSATPGEMMECSATAGDIYAADDDIEPSNIQPTPYELRSNQQGIGRFKLTMKDSGDTTDSDTSHLRSEIVTVRYKKNPNNYKTFPTEFENYWYSEGPHILGYGYTSSAAADGTTPCSVYVIVDPNVDNEKKITKVVFTVNNNAKFPESLKNPQYIEKPLNDDGSTAVDITDDTVEKVTVKFALTQSPDSGDHEQFDIDFVKFPSDEDQPED